MGLTYKGGSRKHRELSENVENVNIKRNGNHFGTSHNKSTYVYEQFCDDPVKTAKEFYDKIGYGGKFMECGNENRVKMADGTIVNYREVTKSGPPSVEINVRFSNNNYGIKSHKIHFIKRK